MLTKDISYEIATLCIFIIIEYYFRAFGNIPIYQNKVYIKGVRANALSAFFSIVCVLIDSFYPSMILRYIATIGYYIPHLLLLPLLVYYAICQRTVPKDFNGVLRATVVLPISVCLIMLVSSPFTHIVFSVSPDGVYQRENLIIVYLTAAYYLLYLIFYTVKYRRDFSFMCRSALICICFGTILSVTVQYFIPESPVENCAVALCLLMLFFSIQNPRTLIDESGALNGNAFNAVMKYNFSRKKCFFLLDVVIDDFDIIERTFGSEQLNESIAKIKEYLSTLDEHALVYRVDDSSFCMEIYGVNAKMATDLCEKIIERFNSPWELSEGTILLSARVCRIGCPDDAQNENRLNDILRFFMLNKTEKAVVNASEIDYNAINRSKAMESALKNALSLNALEVMYVPVYSTSEKRITCAEATIRFHDDELGYVYPDEFMAIAEKTGYAIHIGDVIFEHACRFISSSKFSALGLKYISIKLSAVQCVQYGVAEKFSRLMNIHHINPENICFRVSESMMVSAASAIEGYMDEFSRVGVKFCLDNYGTGYSNISYIYTLPLDFIKVNKDVVLAASENPKAYITLESTLSLVKDLGMSTMVEGVENRAAFRSVSRLTCDYAQGYYFSAPLDISEFISYVEKFVPPAVPSMGGAM